jgi:Protein of unknown function (DUF1700)
MALTQMSQKTVDAYLKSLRRELRELLDEDAEEIVEEIRTHVFDKTSGDESPDAVTATLAALGTPQELAERYRTQELLERARLARSPKYVMRAVRRWAGLSVMGLLIFALSAVGYCLGGALFSLGVLKLLHPGTTGVYGTWTDHDRSFNWQSGGPNKPGELLGWWLVPVGILIGGGLLLLTFRFGNWSIRRFWRPRAWQRP